MGVEEVYVWTVQWGGARGPTSLPWHCLRHQVVEQAAGNHKELLFQQLEDQEGLLAQAWAPHLSMSNFFLIYEKTLSRIHSNPVDRNRFSSIRKNYV